MSDEKIEIKKSELESLIRQKVKEEINNVKNNSSKQEVENKKLSRRKFLKKAGFGALGIGALTISPAGALDIKDDDFSVLTSPNNSSTLTQALFVDGNQNVDVPNGKLTEQGDRIATREWSNSNYFSGSHQDLSNIGSSDHHSRYTDSEAQEAVKTHSYSYSTSNTGTTWVKVGTITDSGGSLRIDVTDTSSFVDSKDDTHIVGKAQAGNGQNEFGGHYYQIGSRSKSDGIELVDQSTYAEVFVRLESYARGVIHATANSSASISFNTTTTDPSGTELEQVMPIQSPIKESGNRIATRNWTDNNYNNYSDSQAAAAAPVQSVNGEEGSVQISTNDMSVKFIDYNKNIPGSQFETETTTFSVDNGVILGGYMSAAYSAYDYVSCELEIKYASGSTENIQIYGNDSGSRRAFLNEYGAVIVVGGDFVNNQFFSSNDGSKIEEIAFKGRNADDQTKLIRLRLTILET